MDLTAGAVEYGAPEGETPSMANESTLLGDDALRVDQVPHRAVLDHGRDRDGRAHGRPRRPHHHARAHPLEQLSALRVATFDPVSSSLRGSLFAQFAVGVIGTLFITSEYTSGSIRTTLTAVPNRFRLIAGKFIVLFVTMLGPRASSSASPRS